MRRLMLIFMLCVFAASAFALDLNPPNWRTAPRTTFQLWGFDTNNANPLPDVYFGPFNPLPADVRPLAGHEWIAALDNRTGVWPLSGQVFVPIKNFPEPFNEKLIWIQLTWTTKGGVPVTEASGDNGLMVDGTLLSEVPLANGWTHSTYQITLQPNPTQELVHIYGAIYLDEMVIDTICIPEPATLSLLIAGALFAARKRH